jgi:hypothetical protein
MTRNWTILGILINLEFTSYTPNICNITLLYVTLFSYPETIGNTCSQFKPPSLVSHCPPMYACFLHQNKYTKVFKPHICTYHIVIIAMLTLCYSIVLHATKLPNIMCTLIATVMMLGRVECTTIAPHPQRESQVTLLPPKS